MVQGRVVQYGVCNVQIMIWFRRFLFPRSQKLFFQKMWKTPVTKNQAFVHIRSIGRYDSRGTTCHWEIDTYHRRSVSSSVQGNKPKVRQRVMDSPLASVVPLLFYPLSPRYISRKETCSPWQRVNSATAPASVLQQEPVSSVLAFRLVTIYRRDMRVFPVP